MPGEYALSIVLQIFKGKGHIKNCNYYRDVKFLEHWMPIRGARRGAGKKLCVIVTINEMQHVFIIRKLQEEYHAKGK